MIRATQPCGNICDVGMLYNSVFLLFQRAANAPRPIATATGTLQDYTPTTAGKRIRNFIWTELVSVQEKVSVCQKKYHSHDVFLVLLQSVRMSPKGQGDSRK